MNRAKRRSSVIGAALAAGIFSIFFFSIQTWAEQPNVEVVIPEMPTITVSFVRLSDDGKLLLTCGDESMATLRDVDSGTILRQFDFPAAGSPFNARLSDGAMSSDGTRCAIAVDNSVRAWDAKTGRLLNLPKVASDQFSIARISRDGSRLVTFDYVAGVAVWDGNDRRRLKQFREHQKDLSQAAITADGTRAATADVSGKVILWDTKTAKVIHEFQGHETTVHVLRFNNDGTVLLSASTNGTCLLSNTHTGETVRDFSMLGEIDESACISGDGTVIATHNKAGTVQVWNALTGLEMRSVEAPDVRCLALDGKGKRLAIGNHDHEGDVLDLVTGRRILALGGTRTFQPMNFIGASGKRTRSYSDRVETLHDPWTGETLATFSGQLAGLFISDDGNRIFANSFPDSRSSELVDLSPAKHRIPFENDSERRGQACMSADGRRIAICNAETVIVLDADSGNELRTIPVTIKDVGTLSISRDGSRIALGRMVWNVDDGTVVQTIEPPAVLIIYSLISPDGTKLLTDFMDLRHLTSMNALWDLETGRRLSFLKRQKEHNDFSFSGDGKFVFATARDSDSSVMMFDVETGKLLHKLVGHTTNPTSVIGMANGRVVVSAAPNRTLVWDAKTGNELCRFVRAGTPEDWFCVTPEGYFDGTVDARKRVRFRVPETLDFVEGENLQHRFYRQKLFERLLAGDRATELANE